MHANNNSRGFTLIVVVVLLAVLLVLGAGAIKMATSQVAAASGHRRQVALDACAKAARNVLVSQLQFQSAIPKSFSLEVATAGVSLNGGPPPGNLQVTLKNGHDPNAAPSLVKDVTPISNGMLGKGRTPPNNGGNITNDLQAPGTGGSLSGGARVIATCTDAGGRTEEVEFLIRYGV